MYRFTIVSLIISFAQLSFAQSSAEKEAKWMLDRITGVRWAVNHPTIQQMADLIEKNDKAAAARIALQQPQFLNITVKQMALQMSTRDETIRTQFNDFAASFIGVTRDDTDARELLTGNFYYAADPAKVPVGVTIPANVGPDIVASNNHYNALETNRVNLGAVLERRNQQLISISDANDVGNSPDPSGVITSRAFLGAHAIDGTNRRLVEYTFREFMCLSIEQIADTNAPDVRIGRDIDRFPGGDHTKFQTTCKGCHTVMDGFRGAFAKWDFVNGVAEHSMSNATGQRAANADARRVVNKMNKNGTVFAGGYVSMDESWVNHAVRGNNALAMGWRGPASNGTGVRSFGEAVSNSQRFGQCMAKRVFDVVCKRQLLTQDQQILFAQIGSSWESSGYKMKKLFELVATNPNCRPVVLEGL